MSVQETPRNQRYSATKSGVIPRAIFEPESRREPAQPSTLPEVREEDTATTGVFPVISEGQDSSAVGDTDNVKGG